jgi:hypothetical protein
MLIGAGVTLARLVDCSGARLRQTPQRSGERGRDRVPFSRSRKNSKQLSANDIIKFFWFTFTFDRTAITFGFVPAFRMKVTFSHDPQMVFWPFSTTNRSVTAVQGLCPSSGGPAEGTASCRYPRTAINLSSSQTYLNFLFSQLSNFGSGIAKDRSDAPCFVEAVIGARMVPAVGIDMGPLTTGCRDDRVKVRFGEGANTTPKEGNDIRPKEFPRYVMEYLVSR